MAKVAQLLSDLIALPSVNSAFLPPRDPHAGEGRVDRALRLSPGASFWDLAERGRLPPVTCAYVPKLLGLARVAHPDECEDDGDTPEEF